jgi:hypothetical protein
MATVTRVPALSLVTNRLDAACKPESAGFLTVHAPGSATAKRAFFPLPVCTTGQVDLNVRRVAVGF